MLELYIALTSLAVMCLALPTESITAEPTVQYHLHRK